MIHFRVGKDSKMKTTKSLLSRFWRDEQGQDLIEYALMAGFVAVAAGAIMPAGVAYNIQRIHEKLMTGARPVATVGVGWFDTTTVQLISAVLAVAILGWIVARRKGQTDD